MNQKYEVNPDVLVTDLDDELALLDPHTSRMYTLNAVGRAIWQALRVGGKREDQLVQVVTQEFDVAASQAQADIRTLLGDLDREGLVRRV
ncbi:hypothetical protein CBQ26_00110 [Deinococcus indicus]|uniref:PqqD family protein n=1 Tax=Deinococcus indicus TaxID=223556 RepID=A0A2D0A8H2_9DEIO|nr:HPr-rel-A system PqqD family peptide chaperone [Deinococcus indicus]OWL99217.1 hypothetical protein CBQ26_00110 [Deinococcus indicus]